MVAGPIKGHTHAIWSVCFSPDSKKIASGSSDQTIRIWDSHKGNLLIGPLIGHTNSVTSIAFSGDGAYIASGSHDCTVRVWDAMSGRLVLGPLKGHNNWFFLWHSLPIQRGSFQHHCLVMFVFGMQIQELRSLGLCCSTQKVLLLWGSHPMIHLLLFHLIGGG